MWIYSNLWDQFLLNPYVVSNLRNLQMTREAFTENVGVKY